MNKKQLRVPDRIQHMLEAVDNINLDIGNLTEEQFLADGKTQRAVIESIIVIGEAANRIMGLDPTIEQNHQEIWQQLRDAYEMRIVLTHEYFRVDPTIVWTTVKNHIPQLAHLLSRFCSDNYQSGCQ
ncbi:MAG: hypothetical protein CO105_11030 [Comamonadaceae bacterium CG_4_9_14_3_um_filter_60_33]|nr:MAG: hypothetical protein AUK51_12975 [Comamonadaceae bacterium CG2_30_59_20]PIY28321.1 MAG: hypothetical protein COZ09_10445 [Comamonadaceae bacterium CG_4_10_14_3_um_filter_60_42]PJB42571.1 MAG: hypothetical protein CO105_11030 [Comamonadaceae bacterium CG_4_9_14_3_um_filter_60_33]